MDESFWQIDHYIVDLQIKIFIKEYQKQWKWNLNKALRKIFPEKFLINPRYKNA